ncbi:conjugal transfer protein TrbD [Salmonella enterica]|nr:conjugal transfer protein TrbD [Salmonella enterica]EDT6434115.1 conjugal transfer protein TrbD [Salmonella enterica subsp. enterica]EDW6357100.1 conjugal transfer protein TrbD [Salmonella enterica subsp. enterica serovar Sandiego]EBO9790062.1 conjugal transfer protein TrbD [Salmonella enterica]EBR3716420.1 conjugal transfer protein TrbD [Salmonella enterica]
MNMHNVISVPDKPVPEQRRKYNSSVVGIPGTRKTLFLSELIGSLLRDNNKGVKS